MNLSMTVWVKQRAIFHAVAAAIDPPLDVVAVPPRLFGDLLPADRTQPALLFPETEQPMLSDEIR